jgi:hypothetical protein
MAVTDLVTYQEVLTHLSMEPTEAPPERVQPLIAAVTRRLEGVTSSYFVQRQYAEQHAIDRAGYKTLFLYRRPIISIVSIHDDEGNTVNPNEYYVYAQQGRLQHKIHWPFSHGAWAVTILGGRFANTASVGEDVKQAACILIKDGLDGSGSDTALSESVGPVSVTYADLSATASKSLPNDVLQLMAPYRNLRVF